MDQHKIKSTEIYTRKDYKWNHLLIYYKRDVKSTEINIKWLKKDVTLYLDIAYSSWLCSVYSLQPVQIFSKEWNVLHISVQCLWKWFNYLVELWSNQLYILSNTYCAFIFGSLFKPCAGSSKNINECMQTHTAYVLHIYDIHTCQKINLKKAKVEKEIHKLEWAS